MNPKPLLHLEGAAIFALSIVAYRSSHGGWWLFALLFLAPDLSMIGYAFNARVGADCYNTFHTYTAPVLLAVVGHLAGKPASLLLSLIWIAHIGFDRMLGFGLKYPSGFQDTHLSSKRHRADSTTAAGV